MTVAMVFLDHERDAKRRGQPLTNHSSLTSQHLFNKLVSSQSDVYQRRTYHNAR